MYDQTKIDESSKWINMIEEGQRLYDEITDVLELTTNHRIKKNTDELTKKFIEMMTKIGDGTCSSKDWKFWSQFMDREDPEKADRFASDPNTTFLFPTNPQTILLGEQFEQNLMKSTNSIFLVELLSQP